MKIWPPTTTWFDRINRYRLAATVLVIPFILTILSTDLEWISTPLILRRVIYWIGLGILLVAVALDSWEIYVGKRRVHKMINERARD